jgi:hypothetical protein
VKLNIRMKYLIVNSVKQLSKNLEPKGCKTMPQAVSFLNDEGCNVDNHAAVCRPNRFHKDFVSLKIHYLNGTRTAQ